MLIKFNELKPGDIFKHDHIIYIKTLCGNLMDLFGEFYIHDETNPVVERLNFTLEQVYEDHLNYRKNL